MNLTDQSRAVLGAKAHKKMLERSFYEFVRAAWHVICPEEEFKTNWHIIAQCEHLEAIADGRIKRLISNVPPGTMKSLLYSVFFPCWVWTTRPAKKFMCSSYADTLALRDGAKSRDIITSQWYQERWQVRIRDDTNAKGLYKNDRGGWRLSTTVGGVGTGEHPDIILIDDPLKVKGATSDADRNTVNDWFDGTMTSRGAIKDSAMIIIMQRLHALDLSGYLLAKGGWTHICLPMRYEAPTLDKATGKMVPRMEKTPLGWTDPRTKDGELLWPSVYTDTLVDSLSLAMGIYHAAGQMQQRPAPRGGGMFKREWFTKVLATLPRMTRFVRYWDKAGTQGGTGAATSGSLVGTTHEPTLIAATGPARAQGHFVVVDIISGNWGSAEREAIIKATAMMDAQRYGYVEVWTEQEPGSGGKESAENTVINLVGFTVKLDKVTGSKEVRAEPFASQASVGNVSLIAGGWNAGFIDEAEAFPNGARKDQVDSTGGAVNKLCVSLGGFGSTDGLYTGRSAFGSERLEVTRLGKDEF